MEQEWNPGGLAPEPVLLPIGLCYPLKQLCEAQRQWFVETNALGFRPQPRPGTRNILSIWKLKIETISQNVRKWVFLPHVIWFYEDH